MELDERTHPGIMPITVLHPKPTPNIVNNDQSK